MRGLYAITPDLDDTSELVTKVRAALSGGASYLQYRNKSADAHLRLQQARVLLEVCEAFSVPLIINDYPQLAKEVVAHGVHIGSGDESLEQARAMLGSEKIIGVSCYNDLDRAKQAYQHGASYVAFGSFFPSSVKTTAVRAPIELITTAKASIPISIVAIGGITLDNAPKLIDAGVDAIAVISSLFTAQDIEAAARAFVNLFNRGK